MASYNRCVFIGNLTRDPELSYLPNQTAVCELGLAVNDRWKNRDGEAQERVCFIDCRAFGKRAETLARYVKKGQPILLEGKLQFDQWEDREGQKRSKHRLMIDGFQFLGQAPSQPPQQAPLRVPSVPPVPQPETQQPQQQFAEGGPQGEDIPF